MCILCGHTYNSNFFTEAYASVALMVATPLQQYHIYTLLLHRTNIHITGVVGAQSTLTIIPVCECGCSREQVSQQRLCIYSFVRIIMDCNLYINN